MSSWDKLLKRVKNLDKSLSFEDLSKVLKHYGYVAYKNSGGSHYTFRKKYRIPVTLPYRHQMLMCYVKSVKRAAEMEENDEKE